MKVLSPAEFEKAPSIVQFLYMMSVNKQPVGGKMIEEALAKHPEYFPDEVEHRRKWALIPQSVHDAYWAERDVLKAEVYKDMPPSKGIIGWIDDREGYEQWREAWDKCYAIEKPLAEAIHKKHYGQYGIESTWI